MLWCSWGCQQRGLALCICRRSRRVFVVLRSRLPAALKLVEPHARLFEWRCGSNLATQAPKSV
jgi:hypothetical protein